MQTVSSVPKYVLSSPFTQAGRKTIAYSTRELASLGLTAQQLIALEVPAFGKGICLGHSTKRLDNIGLNKIENCIIFNI